jgi:hypothetical protein
MLDFSQFQFEEVKTKAETHYGKLGEIYCPYFKERIVFNAMGLEHLKFKSRERARSQNDQYMRFKLLYLAPEIIRQSSTLQGKWETKKFEKKRVNSRTDTILMNVTYYEFIALIKRDRVKVIIKQIENSPKFFWSLIPFWGMDVNTQSRIFHEGEPEMD